MSHVSVSEVARRIGCSPRLISDLFYKRALSDEICPVINGRRAIPLDYVPEIEAALRERGHLGGVVVRQSRELAGASR